MEELKKIAVDYYRNTVGVRFFGIKGWCYIVVSIPFLAGSFYVAIKMKNDLCMIFFSFLIIFLWSLAKKEYHKNMVENLKCYTKLNAKDVSKHKATYLCLITSHIGSSLFDVMKISKEILETNNKYNNFVIDNIGYRFSRFLYDPDAKNRILSLLIYLISLIALLTVNKSDPQLVWEVISYVKANFILWYFITGATFILFFYFSIAVPIMFAWTFIVTPILLRFSFADILFRFFISELNRYAFTENRLN
jgi:hypothetical protein